jgi:ribosomal protein L24
MTNEESMYGFTTTDEIQYDAAGLPVGTYKAMARKEEADEKGRGFIVEWEVLEGEHKGKTGKVWYLTRHDSQQTANIAKQNVKRIADATGKPVTPSTPIKNRVLTLVVRQQKKNPDYTEVAKYLPENAPVSVDSDIPFD